MTSSVGVNLATTSGEPVTAVDLTIVPELQTLVVRAHFGGFVWSRPTRVVVKQAGRVDRLVVRDVTRLVQAGLLSLALAVVVIRVVRTIRREKRA